MIINELARFLCASLVSARAHKLTYASGWLADLRERVDFNSIKNEAAPDLTYTHIYYFALLHSVLPSCTHCRARLMMLSSLVVVVVFGRIVRAHKFLARSQVSRGDGCIARRRRRRDNCGIGTGPAARPQRAICVPLRSAAATTTAAVFVVLPTHSKEFDSIHVHTSPEGPKFASRARGHHRDELSHTPTALLLLLLAAQVTALVLCPPLCLYGRLAVAQQCARHTHTHKQTTS